jgi:hypothetical protein
MNQNSDHKLDQYFENKYKQEVLEQINNLELPANWSPKQVIDYITYKIDRK